MYDFVMVKSAMDNRILLPHIHVCLIETEQVLSPTCTFLEPASVWSSTRRTGEVIVGEESK